MNIKRKKIFRTLSMILSVILLLLSPIGHMDITTHAEEQPVVHVWYKGAITAGSTTFYNYYETYVIDCAVKSDGTIEYPTADQCNYPGYELVGFEVSEGVYVEPAYIYTEDTDIYAIYEPIGGSPGSYSWNIGSPTAEDVTATLYLNDGRLVIEGTGDTATYTSHNEVPWSSYSSKIKTVEISDSVQSTNMDYYFCATSVTTTDYIPDTVTSCKYTFSQCIFLESAHIPANALATDCFYSSTIKDITIDLSNLNTSSTGILRSARITGELNFIGTTANIPTGTFEPYSLYNATGINVTAENKDVIMACALSEGWTTHVAVEMSENMVMCNADDEVTVSAKVKSNFNMPDPTYQWYVFDGTQNKYVEISGATQSTLTLTPADYNLSALGSKNLSVYCLVSDGISEFYSTKYEYTCRFILGFTKHLMRNIAHVGVGCLSVYSTDNSDWYRGEAIYYYPGYRYQSSSNDEYITVVPQSDGDVIYFKKQDGVDLSMTLTMIDETDTLHEIDCFINPVLFVLYVTDDTLEVCAINTAFVEDASGSAGTWYFRPGLRELPEEYVIGETYYGRKVKTISSGVGYDVFLPGVKRFTIQAPEFKGSLVLDCVACDAELEYVDISNSGITSGYHVYTSNNYPYKSSTTSIIGFPNLREIHLPSGLGGEIIGCPNVTILDYKECEGSTNVSGVYSLYNTALNEETPLDYVIPDGTTSLYHHNFYSGASGYNSGIRSISGGKNLQRVYGAGPTIFAGREIELVDLSQTQLTTIPAEMFSNCRIGKLILPSSITTISQAAFYNCEIGELVMDDVAATSILSGTFSGAKIGKVHIPESVTTLSSGAFSNCEIGTLILHNHLENVQPQFIYRGTINKLLRDDSERGDTDITFTGLLQGMQNIDVLEIPLNCTMMNSCGNGSYIKHLDIPEGTSLYGCFSSAVIASPLTLNGGSTGTITQSFTSAIVNGISITDYDSIDSYSFNGMNVTNNLHIENIDSFADAGQTIKVGKNAVIRNIETISGLNGIQTEGNLELYNLPEMSSAFIGAGCKGDLIIDSTDDIDASMFGSNSGFPRQNLIVRNVPSIYGSGLSNTTYTGSITIENIGSMTSGAVSHNTVGEGIRVSNVGTINNALLNNRCTGDIVIDDVDVISSYGVCGCKCNNLSVSNVATVDGGTFCGMGVSGTLSLDTIDSIGTQSFCGMTGCDTVSLENVTSIGDGSFYNNAEITNISVSGNMASIGADVFGVAAPKLVQTNLSVTSPYAASVFFAPTGAFSWHTLNRVYNRLTTNPQNTDVQIDDSATFSSSAAIDGGTWQWYEASPYEVDSVSYVMANAATAGISLFAADPYMTEDTNGYTFTIPATTDETLYYNMSIANTEKLLGEVKFDIQGSFLSGSGEVLLRINGVPVTSAGEYIYQVGSVNPLSIEIIAAAPASDVTISLSMVESMMYELSAITGANAENYVINNASMDQNNTLYCCSYGTDAMDDIDMNNPYYIEFTAPALLSVSEIIATPTPLPQTTVAPTQAPDKTGVTPAPTQAPSVTDAVIAGESVSTDSTPDNTSTPETIGNSRGPAANTGDHTNREIYLILLIVGIVGMFIYQIKNKKE